MTHKKKAFVIPLVSAIVILSLLQGAAAETEKGRDYDRQFIGYDKNGFPMYMWTSHPDRLPVGFAGWDVLYADYRLTEDSNYVYLETANAGSVAFNKNNCSYDYYNGGIISGNHPQIKNISWTVKGKANNTSTWSNINSINNAACTVTKSSTEQTVRITGQKQNGAGTFQIILDYSPGRGIKETMRGYNNNPAWTNHNIGFTETFEVPQVIKFGNIQYDLAQYNNTVLGRTWIENNQAKIVRLTDKINYDMGIGFTNLNDIKITYINNVPRLSLNYLYPNGIVPYQTWFEVDPTFGYSSAQSQQYLITAPVTQCVGAAGNSNGSSAITSRVSIPSTGAADNCVAQLGKFIITSIPDTATITSANFRHDRGVAGGSANEIKLVGRNMTLDPQGSATAAQKWVQITQGNFVLSPWTESAAGTNDIVRPFNSNGTTSIQNRLVNNWYGLALSFVSMRSDAVAHNIDNLITWELQVNYTVPTPDAVNTLVATQSPTTTVYLGWSQPALHGGTLDGYIINYTTPFGPPTTVLVSNTGNSLTSYAVTGLAEQTPYSFRVSAITGSNKNITGANIANATTGLNSGNFTIGFFSLNATNGDRLGINFERTDTNSSSTTIKVIYDEDYTLDCNINYRLAQLTDTYSNVSGSVYSSTQLYHNFIFLNHENDIINIRCFDRDTNDTGNFMLNQNTQWVLKEMINNFRNGGYGTHGQFGAFDVVTLVVLTFGMIGLNRVNEGMAAIIMLFALGVLAYFEFIIWPVALVGGIALIIVAAIVTTRKD